MEKITIYGFIAVVILGGVLFYFFGGSQTDRQPLTVPPADTAAISEAGNLGVEDIEIGSGAEAKAGDLLFVHYLGALADGRKFDSSYDRGEPFQFSLGAGQVIQGWDLGLLGMKIGGKRKLTIPPELGYGDRAVGSIPANSVLIFEVELLNIRQ